MPNSGPRTWQGTKRRELDAEVRRLTAGKKSEFIKFDDRLREVYRERVDMGESFSRASRIAHEIAFEELQARCEAAGLAVDADDRFAGVPFEAMDRPDYARDFAWVLENLGRENIRKKMAPSGNAWNMYSFAKSGDEGLKKVMDWGMRMAPLPAEEEPVEEVVEEGLDALVG